MLSQFVGPDKCFVTGLTIMRLFSRMDFFMPSQFPEYNKSFVTGLTCMWPFTSMSFHMSFQITGSSETFWTEFTLVWLFTSMHHYMQFQMFGTKESFLSTMLEWQDLWCHAYLISPFFIFNFMSKNGNHSFGSLVSNVKEIKQYHLLF